jgi:heptosyltransferase III
MDESRIKRILIVVQRSNGDVFLSSPLIEGLFRAYGKPQIDLLINDDTLAVARTLPHIENIYQFSYKGADKGLGAITFHLLKKIARHYDLSISLTASDRSVIFALAASGYSISAVDASLKKSWWKRLLLSHHYIFDSGRHIIENNTTPLDLLGIGSGKQEVSSHHSSSVAENIEKMLDKHGISRFVIFHPGAQYTYKVYPETLRNILLEQLNSLGIALVVTGSKSSLDLEIKRSIPKLKNVHDFIGETTIDEFIALSDRSLAYIGADTLNMHIAASQNKRIFAIYGPTLVSMWSPWSNSLHTGTHKNSPSQTYGDITLFQADMSCVSCGKAGCDDRHGVSECLCKIDPDIIYKEVEQWLTRFR